MATYFVFSDEAGEYKANPNDAFCRRRPYYVRSAVILDVESWALLKEEYFKLKKENKLPTDKEIKWSYLWSLTKHYDNQESIPTKKPYYFLKDYKLSALCNFVTNSCELLAGCSFCRIVLTVTPNEVTNTWSKSSIYKWHLQEIMCELCGWRISSRVILMYPKLWRRPKSGKLNLLGEQAKK